MNPLLAPPLLVLRALDDLHQIATVAPRFVEAAELLAETGERMLELGERIDARADQIIAMGDKFEALGDIMTEEVRATHAAAADVVEAAREVMTAVPLLEQAIALATPLEGAVERFARMVDRLPGGKRSAAAE